MSQTSKPVSAQKVVAVLKAAGLPGRKYGALDNSDGYTVFKNPHTGVVEVYYLPSPRDPRTKTREGFAAAQSESHEKAVKVLSAVGIEAAIEPEINPVTGEPAGVRQIYCRSISA